MFYRRLVIASWNIVKYNILSSSGGPELYGTEPWTFYFRNLLLNFNIWFILAMIAGPLFLVQKLMTIRTQGFGSGLRTLVFLSPFYLWLAIFSLQPHKEERFMYPAYPLLVLNAAIATHSVLVASGHVLHGKTMAYIKLGAFAMVLLLSVVVSIARVYGVWSAYSAPLYLYQPLWQGSVSSQYNDTVCYGKEWYRFPSSYFLPNNMHAKFVRSEFRGLLPGEFDETGDGWDIRSGTHLPTRGLNDRNEEAASTYVALDSCQYHVDTQYPDRNGVLPPNEPDYVAAEERWEVVKCTPFLDAARTPTVARMVWTPDLAFLPDSMRRRWGWHCLLRRKDKAELGNIGAHHS